METNAMNILITGANGFVGRNLAASLEAIRDGLDRTHPELPIGEVFLYDVDTRVATLDRYCAQADFVFHLAGVNRPKEEAEFMTGNFGLTSMLLETLKRHKNDCPVMLASSIQAELDNPYGKSKRAGEDLLFAYGRETGAQVLAYRFPNLFGKWGRPNYNSAVATFCHNIARGIPIQINDPQTRLRLCYIDDVVAELLAVLNGHAARDGIFCCVPTEYDVTLGQIAGLLEGFQAERETRQVPDLSDPFTKKLYATYLSYLPTGAFSYPLDMHRDARGSFTEILRTPDRGQCSVNISKPGITKGNHWHHTKHEKFLVVSGTGAIRFRRPGSSEILTYLVSGDKLEVVDIPPGYTHQIENLGQSDLVTFMWCSECFDPARPDTFFLEV